MSYSINQVFLVGNVASEVELKFTPSSMAVCNFSVATNRSVKKNDQWETVATFHKIVVWGKLAESLANTLSKGKKVTISGRIDNRSYEAQDGSKRYVSEVVADSVIFDSSNAKRVVEQMNEEPSQDPEPPLQEPPVKKGKKSETTEVEDVSDDIPF